ncbi:MAG: PorP/SprF family type IX secretion system membrane protein [Bacteroidales bacterium]|nr:PorP/SprF family type IX secretion system membrane protein [Bacteroidales bacterium]
MRKIIYILLALLSFSHTKAQDPHHSHFYAVPLLMGPSFAGSTGGTRVAINARNQWTAIPQQYNTASIMFDHYFYGTRHGLGAVLHRDQAGAGKLATTYLQAQYAYSINASKNIAFRPGMQVSFVNRHIDYSKTVFGDQLDFIENRPNSIEPALEENNNYLDFGASLLGIYKSFWFGGTLDHLIQPNQSLNNENSIVPLKISFYTGMRFNIQTKFNNKRQRDNMYVMMHFNKQDTFKQMLYGAYWERQKTLMGIWYRGMPYLKAYQSYMNTDALILMFGYTFRQFLFLYSYDLTLSKLTANSAGSHEITIVWQRPASANEQKHKNRFKIVPCPMQDNYKSGRQHNQHNM